MLMLRKYIKSKQKTQKQIHNQSTWEIFDVILQLIT